MKKIYYLFILLAGLFITSCKGYLDPVDDKPITDEMLIADPGYAEGVLIHAYQGLPDSYNYNSEAATNNAVSNDKSLDYSSVAKGAWSSEYNPFDEWDNSYENIYYVNKFLSIYEQVNWSNESGVLADYNYSVAQGHLKRLKGESFGLRAFYELQLLQSCAGPVGEKMMGFPIVTTVVSNSDNYKMDRNTFDECVAQIVADCDVAIANLPLFYADSAGNTIWNKTFGKFYTDRLDARGAKAIKAQALLMAASPAFNKSNDLLKWENAAMAAADLINISGKTLPANGLTFYDLASATAYNTDIIWANSKTNRNDWEKANYPPSLYGNGNINPTQNLVDAFPMANGYPITDAASLYDATKPYNGRDARLAKFIVTDGATQAALKINTFEGAPLDGINVLNSSTRTGYYMAKFLTATSKYNTATGTWSNSARAYVHYRYTEMYLNFAEAANEAWGPTGDPKGLGFTAQSVLAQIRKRANSGIGTDPYLTSVANSGKDTFRALVQNSRRLELCFEGKYFWDIRRWNKIQEMKEPAKGVSITDNAGAKTYNYITVEERKYEDYMIYPPIPYSAVIKTGVTQNQSW